jgi:hypothetical protein
LRGTLQIISPTSHGGACPCRVRHYLTDYLTYLNSTLGRASASFLDFTSVTMSSSPASDETAYVSQCATGPVKITTVQNARCKNSHDDQSDASDFPEGGITAWGTALGA